LEGRFIKPAEMEWEQVRSWAKRLVVHAEKCSAVVNVLGGDRKSILHQHPHEQISYIISGRTEFTVGNKTAWVEAGDIIVIPPNTDHGGGESECSMIDFFTPVREDFVAAKRKVKK
jgi:quercetin dioxygenase-like cupin family protein